MITETVNAIIKYSGYTFWASEEIMPRINDAILKCSIFLYQSRQSALESENIGGSGFIVGVPSSIKEGGTYLYAVTNRHVILPAIGNSPVIRVNTVSDKVFAIEYEFKDWECHPDGDDLAIVPINPPVSQYKLNWVPSTAFITQEIIKKENIGAGDEIFMVGRFSGLDNLPQNEPTLRFGNLTTSSIVKLKNEYDIRYDSFLAEMRSLSGYSGSPTFVHILPFSKRPESKGWAIEQGPWLLGIDCGHVPDFAYVYEKNEKDKVAGEWKTKINTGIASIIPVWKLVELLNIPKFVEMRSVNDKEIEKKMLEEKKPKQVPPISLDSLSGGDLTKDEFHKILDKASQPIEKPESDSKQP